LGYLAYPGYLILGLSRFTRLSAYRDYPGYLATFLAVLPRGHSTLPGVTCHFSPEHMPPCFHVFCNNAENNLAVIHYRNRPFTL
jgi:hypothetical protein